ncbi:hypothetical protein AB0K93_20905 [Streptomyces sp. NPDC052676]|uniref:hypothetical protein n=1 Tax=Streptomyces sp. NPDC052676 TaxID=3154953 RepID=UPI003446806B
MSDDNDVWAVDDWVPADVKRRSTRALATVLTLTIIGGGLYLAGIVTIRSALGWPLFVSGLLVLVAVIVLVTAANPYRRVSGDAELPHHIFHLSPERWDEGATVTLEVQRCRKKQFIAESRWGRRSRLVYFFPQRPTRQQALGRFDQEGSLSAGRVLNGDAAGDLGRGVGRAGAVDADGDREVEAVDGSSPRGRGYGVEVPHRGAVAGRAGAVR